MNNNVQKSALFRFYEELNDFLPKQKRKTDFTYAFLGNPSVKDAVEAIGVPHVEVDLILVNGKSVTFQYHLQAQDRISVYPVFEQFDISSVTRLRAHTLRNPSFILDVHLGKLAKYLRLLGFDTLYRNDYEDSEIVSISCSQGRIILTRDVGLLKHDSVSHGYWLRSQHPSKQLYEVIKHFDLYTNINPFSRCIECNGHIYPVCKDLIEHYLKPGTKRHYNEFYQCQQCGRIYWKGSHYQRMKAFAQSLQLQHESTCSFSLDQQFDN